MGRVEGGQEGSGSNRWNMFFPLLGGGKGDFLNIPLNKQQFGDMDVPKSPQ